MSSMRLKARVPSAEAATTAALPGHILRFHKSGKDRSAKCDAHQTGKPAHSVIGVVFVIDDGEKPVLDAIEGVGSGYEEKTVEIFSPGGQVFEAFTYYATDIDPTIKPYHWYKQHVLAGARENDLPEKYIEQISTIESIADPDPVRHQQEMAIYE